MADVITGKVWNLDTATGMVSTNPVYIHSIRVRFTTAGVGSCIISTGAGTQDMLLNLITTDASTAAVWDTSVQYTFGNQCFPGLQKVVCVNVSSIQVVTCNPL